MAMTVQRPRRENSLGPQVGYEERILTRFAGTLLYQEVYADKQEWIT